MQENLEKFAKDLNMEQSIENLSSQEEKLNIKLQ
jgi:hypothetical protein